MQFLDKLMPNNKMVSKDIAEDMIKDSKFGITSLATAATEAVNPGLRAMLSQQLDKAITEHFQLSDMLISKGWYPAYDEPMEQVKKEYEESQKLT